MFKLQLSWYSCKTNAKTDMMTFISSDVNSIIVNTIRCTKLNISLQGNITLHLFKFPPNPYFGEVINAAKEISGQVVEAETLSCDLKCRTEIISM